MKTFNNTYSTTTSQGFGQLSSSLYCGCYWFSGSGSVKEGYMEM